MGELLCASSAVHVHVESTAKEDVSQRGGFSGKTEASALKPPQRTALL